MTLLLDVPLTPEQFARLHPALQGDDSWAWIADTNHPTLDELDATLAYCNRAVLRDLAPFYFTPSAQHTQHPTHPAGVRDVATLSPAKSHAVADGVPIHPRYLSEKLKELAIVQDPPHWRVSEAEHEPT